jgi:hypothetical protein
MSGEEMVASQASATTCGASPVAISAREPIRSLRPLSSRAYFWRRRWITTITTTITSAAPA